MLNYLQTTTASLPMHAVCPKLGKTWVNFASSRGELTHQFNCEVSLFNCAWLVFVELLPTPAAFSSVFQSWHTSLWIFLIYILSKKKKKSLLWISSLFWIFLKGKGRKCYRDAVVCFLPTYRDNDKNSFPPHRVICYAFDVHWWRKNIWSVTLCQWMWSWEEIL